MTNETWPITLLVLDDYHLGDPLFFNGLGRSLAARSPGTGVIAVHGTGERAARRLTAAGGTEAREDGVLVTRTPKERRIVEIAAREINQKIVASLTDEGVAAVGFQGFDRRLISRTGAGDIVVGRTGWVLDLASKGVVAVVSSMGRQPDDGDGVEEPLEGVITSLYKAIRNNILEIVLFTLNERAALSDDTSQERQGDLALAEKSNAIPHMELLRLLVGMGARVVVTNVREVFRGAERVATVFSV